MIAADSLLGVHRLGARIALTSLLVLGVVAAARRWLIAMPRRITALEVAHSIQERYPHLRSLVASAVEFSAQDPKDPTGGSADLRRGVVVRAAS